MQQPLSGIENLGRRVLTADYFLVYTPGTMMHLPPDYAGLDHLFVLETDVERHPQSRRDFYIQILAHPFFAKEMESSLRAVFFPTSYDTSTPALHRYYRHRMTKCGLVEHSASPDAWIAQSLNAVYCVLDGNVAPVFLFVDAHCVDTLVAQVSNSPGITNVRNFLPTLGIVEEIIRLKGRAIFPNPDFDNNYIQCVQR